MVVFFLVAGFFRAEVFAGLFERAARRPRRFDVRRLLGDEVGAVVVAAAGFSSPGFAGPGGVDGFSSDFALVSGFDLPGLALGVGVAFSRGVGLGDGEGLASGVGLASAPGILICAAFRAATFSEVDPT